MAERVSKHTNIMQFGTGFKDAALSKNVNFYLQGVQYGSYMGKEAAGKVRKYPALE